MPYINETKIMGYLGRPAEVRYSQAGKPYANFSIAVSRGKDKETDWFDCTIFNDAAERMATEADKGSLVYVEGAMQSRKYEGKTYWSVLVRRAIWNWGKQKPNGVDSIGQEVSTDEMTEVPW